MKLNKEFLVGLVVVSAIAVLYIGVNYLKGINLFMDKQKFYAVYNNVSGLEAASPVVLNGFKIGAVKNVALHTDGSGRIVAEVIINDKKLKLPRDTKFEIFDADLFGGKSIQIIVGSSPEYAVSGDTLSSGVVLGITESIKQEIEPLKKKTAQIFTTLDSLLTGLSAALRSEDSQGIEVTFRNIQQTFQNLATLTGDMTGTLAENRQNFKEIFRNTRDISDKLLLHTDVLTGTLKNANRITDSLANANIGQMLRSLESAVTGLNKVLLSLNNEGSSLGKITHTDSLHHQLLTAGKSLDFLLNDIQENPKRYISVSVFGGKEDHHTKLTRREKELIREEVQRNMKEEK
jgi:phospholipid/cholesterol/gamma-HCH transport system substrate-binding protein